MEGRYESFANSQSVPSNMVTYVNKSMLNGESVNLDLPHKAKLSPAEYSYSGHSRRTSMDNMHSDMTNGMCVCRHQVDTVQQKPSKDETSDVKENKELKPSDFMFFAANSTFHGMSHIFTPGSFTLRRALWAIAFVSSLGFFLQQGYDRYKYYRSHPHVTKLDEEEATSIQFPALTLCNMNPFRLSALTTDDFFFAGEQILELFDSNYNLRENGFRDNRTWPYVQQKINPILEQRGDYKPTSRNLNMFDLYNRTGHLISGMVKSCSYRGQNCQNLNDWSPVFTRYGKCYTFNSGKVANYTPLTTPKGGVDNGLELLLDTQQDDYMPVWDETDEISIEAGFKVQIHAQSEPPFIHELGFGISPGFQTLVATQEQRITFLPEPYGNCQSGFNRSRHIHYETYSISACRITCETQFVFEACQCRMVHMPGNESYCSPEVYKKCADRHLDYLVESDEKICICGTPCEVTRYNLEMSILQLPSTQALSYLAYKYRKSEEYVKNNFVKLNVFFEALNYETIEQKRAYEIPGLFGDIGGQMGLFIGASILTILELFDYFYELIKEKTWGKKLREAKKRQAANALPPQEISHPQEVQHMSKQLNSAREIRVDERIPYATYNHLSPLREFESGSQQTKENRPNNLAEFRSLPAPPPQYLGNSLMVLRDDRPTKAESKQLDPRFGPGASSLVRRYPARTGREMSMSYNDLYTSPESYWSDSDPPTLNYTAPRCTTALGNASAYASSNTNLMSSSNYFRQPSAFSMTNGTQKQSVPVISSPTPAMTDLQEYSPSIETDIH